LNALAPSAVLLPRAVVAVAVVLASVGAVPAVAAGDSCSPPAPPIEQVRLVANGWIDEDGLRRIAGLEDPVVWSDGRREEIRSALMRTEVFRSIEIRLVAEGPTCVLVLELERRPTVSRLHLSGPTQPGLASARALWRWATRNEDRAPPPQDREIRRLLRLRPGSLFDEETLERGTTRILALYHARGYQAARVSTRISEADGAVEIFVVVRPGAPLLVTEVQAVVDQADARRVVDEVLEGKLGGAKVRHLARDTRREILRRLRELGHYDAHLEVRWRPIDATRGGLLVEVEAGPQRTIAVIGNESIREEDLLQRDRLYSRVFVTNNTWRQMGRAMEAEYQRRGFFEATVEVDTSADREVVYQVVEGRKFKVTEVRFEGNETLAADDLRDAVATGRRGWLGPIRPPRAVDEVLAEDVDRVRETYLRAGFESAAVERRVELDREQGTAVVTFAVTEGPRTWVRSVAWDAATPDLGESTDPDVTLGRPLDIVAVETERDRLVSLLRQSGYRDARVKFEIRREADGDVVHADVSWEVAAGAMHRFDEIVVQGNAEVQYVVIERDLPFVAGDAVAAETLLKAQQKIYESGVFQNVSIAPMVPDEDPGASSDDAEPDDADVPEEDNRRPVAVTVAARPPGRFGYGFGYDTRQGLTGFGEVAYGNLNHRAQRLRLRAQVGFDPGTDEEPTQYLVTAGFSEPRLWDGKWDLHLNTLAERNTRTIDQFNIERVSAAVGSSRTIGDRLQVGADVQGEFARVFDVEPIPFRARDDRDAWTTSLSPFLVYDGRDSPFDPQRGVVESLRLRYAVPGVSTTDFVELNAQHTQLIPLWRDWVLAYSIRAGWVRSLDGDPIVPIRQRYFVGGGESVRGFAVNSLGPYDGNGNEIGGDLAVVAKSELRIPLIGGLGLVLFVDGGGNYLLRCDASCRAGDPSDPTTTIRDGAVTLDNFRRTAGMGLRYVTPVGPISVDYGVKLDRRDRSLADGSLVEESFGEFSVSIGARF
jgi:outer membrane protein assembly complex protein YaeT